MRGLPLPTVDEIHKDMAASCVAGVIEHARLAGLLPDSEDAAKGRALRQFLAVRFKAAISDGFADARAVAESSPELTSPEGAQRALLQFWHETLSETRTLIQRERATREPEDEA